ncbi:MAG: hypothetical protein ACR2OO_04615 [Thermomicrobiales bacterium]
MPLSDATLRYAEELTTALLGLDALYAREQGKDPFSGDADIDRLVVLNMSTTHRPDAFASYFDAQARFGELRDAAAALPEADRQVYYRQTCGSAISFATWREEGLPFERQLTGFLHVPAAPPEPDELDAIHTAMRPVLRDLGFDGGVEPGVKAWEARTSVPADKVEDVLNDLMSQAWDLTAERMAIPAGKSDGMRVETVRDVPYNAMCDYKRRLVRLNLDPVLTMAGLRHLAVHEGCPGHYVQFKRREAGYAAGTSPADVLLSVVNTASSTPFEGIADAGMAIIGWDVGADDRLGALLTRYRSGLAARAAWRLHGEGWSPAAVRDELLADALTGGEAWVDSRMRFISADDRAVLIWSYWHGEPSVSALWARVADRPEAHPAYFDFLYDRMHSRESLALFEAPSA